MFIYVRILIYLNTIQHYQTLILGHNVRMYNNDNVHNNGLDNGMVHRHTH